MVDRCLLRSNIRKVWLFIADLRSGGHRSRINDYYHYLNENWFILALSALFLPGT
jgi:hypothetical protein